MCVKASENLYMIKKNKAMQSRPHYWPLILQFQLMFESYADVPMKQLSDQAGGVCYAQELRV